MQNPENPFNAVRLSLDKGFVLLHQFRMPTLVCTLVELSGKGCKCIAPHSGLDFETVQSWREKLNLNMLLSVEISSGTLLNHFAVVASVAHIQTSDEKIDITLQFANLTAFQVATLEEAAKVLHPERYIDEPPATGTDTDFALPIVKPKTLPPMPRTTMMRKRFEELPPTPLPPPDPVPEAVNVRSSSAIMHPAAMDLQDTYRGKRLGAILVATRKLTERHIDEAERKASMTREFLGQYLIRMGLLTPIEVCRALSLQSGLPMVELPENDIPKLAQTKFPFPLMLKHEFVPYYESPEMICVAAKHPMTPQRIAELEDFAGKHIEVFLAPDHQIAHVLNELRPSRNQIVRKSARIKAELPISVQVCDEQANPEGPMFEGMTTDISEEGFKIELPRGAFDLLAEESQHGLRHMRVILNLQPDHVQGICKVCHVKRKEHVTKTAHCSVGLQVTGMNGIARQQLKNMCVRIGLDKMRDRLWRG